MQAEIKNIAVDRVLPNPHRDIDNYPIKPSKVDALVRSIEHGDIGLWPSIIGRQVKGGYEMAFGHHRLEAAKQAGLKTVPLIVMDLDDKQMLQYMGRENGEDFGTDFMVLLNTWEAGVRFVKGTLQNHEPIDVARLLGWVEIYESHGEREIMTPPALAANSAYKLIADGYLKRDVFIGLSVENARNISQRTLSMMKDVDTSTRTTKRDAKTAKALKDRIAAGARTTAAGVRAGEIPHRQVRQQTEANAYKELGKSKEQLPKPLFDRFAYGLCASINTMVSHDPAAERLEEIVKNLQYVTLEVDNAATDAVQGSLVQLGKRAGDWNEKIRSRRMKGASNAVAITKRAD